MKTIDYYTPNDNSFAQCLDDNCKNHMLAGTISEGKTTKLKVIVQPFDMQIIYQATPRLKEPIIGKFIIGLDEKTGLRHLVMFYEQQTFEQKDIRL